MKFQLGNLTLNHKPQYFVSLTNAMFCVDHSEQMRGIILGDDGRYWVVCMADYNRLVKAGYSEAL